MANNPVGPKLGAASLHLKQGPRLSNKWGPTQIPGESPGLPSLDEQTSRITIVKAEYPLRQILLGGLGIRLLVNGPTDTCRS